MNKQEPELFSKGALAIFAVVITIALILAFPGKRLFTSLSNQPVDVASLAYARAAFNREPNNPEARLRLVEKLYEISEVAEATSLLKPLLDGGQPSIKVAELDVKLKFQRFFELQIPAEKEAIKQELMTELKRLFPQISSIPKLEELAELSTELGEPSIAADIYRHIVELQEAASPQAANSLLMLLGINDAQAEEPVTTKPKQYYIEKQLQSLLAANTGNEALKWAEFYVKQNPHNAAILQMAIEIAQSQNKAVYARDWGRLLFSLQSDDKGSKLAIPTCQSGTAGEKTIWECNPKTADSSKISLPSVAFVHFVKQLNSSKSPLETQFQKELAADQLGESLAWMQQQVKAHPKSEEHLRLAGLLANNLGNHKLASELGREILKLKPNDIGLLQQQIAYEKNIGNHQGASELSKQLLQLRPNDPTVLQQQIEYYRSIGNRQVAKDLGAQLVKMKPSDTQLLQQQIDLEMAIPDLPQALAYTQKWLELAPDNQNVRSKMADIALWAGSPDISLAQLKWLYQHTQDPAHLKKITELASGLFKHELLADLYTEIGGTRRLSSNEANDWFNALQQSGRQDAGHAALQQYVKHWPQEKSAWLLLAKTQELLGKLEEANQTLQQIDKHFGVTPESKLTQANYLLKLGRIQDAWQTLLKAATKTPANNAKFWEHYAATAFLVGAERDMLNAYQRNANVSQNNASLNYHLLNMLRQSQDSKQYSHFALQIFNRTKEPAILLDLINYKIQHNEWPEAQQLLAQLNTKEHKVAESSQYWLTKAEVAAHFGDKQGAQQAISTALRLEPNSSTTRSLFIWHLIAQNNKPELAKLLHESKEMAETTPLLWESMAAGYRAISDPRMAIHWYAKAVKQWPDRQPLVMGYADVLQEANYATKAKQLWQHTLAKLKGSDVVAARPNASADALAFERRYAELVRLYLGANAGEQWLKWLQQHQDQRTADFSEFRISWFLAQQRLAQAQALAQQVEREGKELPVWQRLALAINTHDVGTIKQILATASDKLTKLDQISALRAIGANSEALRKVTGLLAPEQTEAELAALRQQAVSLNQQQPHGWAIGGKYNNISQLDIFNDSAEIAWNHDKHNVYANYQDFFYSRGDNTILVPDNMQHEQTVDFEWRYLDPNYSSRLRLGGSFRDDYDYFKAESSFNYLFQNGWNAQIEAGYNMPSSESAIFRLAGLTDQLNLRLGGEFSRREYFALNFQGRNYKTRSGQSVGLGYGGGFELGYRVLFDKPETVIALYGNWKEAGLDRELPTEWQSLVDANLKMDSILNRSYKEIGLDLRLKEGELRPFGFTDRSFRYFAEVGGFYTDPTGNFGAKVRAGIGTRLFKNDELSLSGFYSSVQGGAQSIPSTALELRYSRRFD